MKLLGKSIYSIYLLLLFVPIKGNGQNVEPEDTLKIKLMNAARQIMTATSTCALITLDGEGLPRVRTMDPFIPENDLTVWFGTNPKSRKVDQIKKDPRVTLYYLDSDESGYVMMHGIAQLVNDENEKEKRWKNAWEAFYPDRSEGYLLIKVSPKWVEVISYTHGIFGDPSTWQAPRIVFD